VPSLLALVFMHCSRLMSNNNHLLTYLRFSQFLHPLEQYQLTNDTRTSKISLPIPVWTTIMRKPYLLHY